MVNLKKNILLFRLRQMDQQILRLTKRQNQAKIIYNNLQHKGDLAYIHSFDKEIAKIKQKFSILLKRLSVKDALEVVEGLGFIDEFDVAYIKTIRERGKQ